MSRLHELVGATSTQKITKAESVAHRVTEYVSSMTRVARSKTHTLGLYQNVALKSKQRQLLWVQSSQQSIEDLAQELQEESLMLAIDSVDKPHGCSKFHRFHSMAVC